MPQIPKDVRAQQIKMFIETKKDYPHRSYTIVDTLDAARLMDKKLYPYEHETRLYRDITDACKDAIDQVAKLMSFLTPAYRNEILFHDACRVIRSWTLQRIREERYSGKPFSQKEFDHYSDLLSESMEGISLMMPSSFADLIEPNVSALRETLTCFSDFAMANHLERKIPLFKSPAAALEDPNTATSKKP